MSEPGFPVTVDDALAVLERIGGPPRLMMHGRLVAEAADELLAACRSMGVLVDESLVRAGAVLHDAGKILFPAELDVPGARHEDAGHALLIDHGLEPRLARCCLSHARWKTMPCSIEELLVALADCLWKGVRRLELESQVIAEVAQRSGVDRWKVLVTLDSTFEAVADGAVDRLVRSRV